MVVNIECPPLSKIFGSAPEIRNPKLHNQHLLYSSICVIPLVFRKIPLAIDFRKTIYNFQFAIRTLLIWKWPDTVCVVNFFNFVQLILQNSHRAKLIHSPRKVSICLKRTNSPNLAIKCVTWISIRIHLGNLC